MFDAFFSFLIAFKKCEWSSTSLASSFDFRKASHFFLLRLSRRPTNFQPIFQCNRFAFFKHWLLSLYFLRFNLAETCSALISIRGAVSKSRQNLAHLTLLMFHLATVIWFHLSSYSQRRLMFDLCKGFTLTLINVLRLMLIDGFSR